MGALLRIGILGAARIAPRAIIEPCRRRADVTVAAVASRRADSAEAFASLHRIEKAYTSYQAMLDDRDIDLVYVALPPSHHAEWTIRALEAGKHVLCEKPLALNAAEAETMFATAERCGRILVEAFHYRHHPLFEHIVSLRQKLGKVSSIRAEFHVDIPWDREDIRYDPALGGGAMMDLGVYPLHWLRSFMGSEPEIIAATARVGASGVDTRMEATLRFEQDVDATMIADIQDPPFRPWLRIEAAQGCIEVDNPSSPHRGHSIRSWRDGILSQYTVGGGTTYDYQLAAFLRSASVGIPSMENRDDAIGNMAAVDRIYALTMPQRRPLR
ncbi:Gfo/Idh/MocA family protein [Devosia sp. SL43]|uniref:Gfo/Idh/MocA family protein n=1 Tax=Devosia sp. SL43 TaxID=2806348 RepID=UPI001F15DB29|nr:Gfo/Idh/MocA family oxidoreductase [Devosia sp. SL43]UJW86517.1 Gfo/Idh/MocA family oxidoreductase [Devosia sp. SL43]